MRRGRGLREMNFDGFKNSNSQKSLLFDLERPSDGEAGRDKSRRVWRYSAASGDLEVCTHGSHPAEDGTMHFLETIRIRSNDEEGSVCV